MSPRVVRARLRVAALLVLRRAAASLTSRAADLPARDDAPPRERAAAGSRSGRARQLLVVDRVGVLRAAFARRALRRAV